MPPRLVGVGSLFIDDIVLPDGETHMGQLGGGVLYALMGVTLWGETPGIVGFVGDGIPAAAVELLQDNFDTQGLHHLPIPQARTWQIFEHDGSRLEIPRVNNIQPFVEGPQPKHLPESYRDAEAIYLIQSFEGIQEWVADLNGLILWEPLQQIMVEGAHNRMRDALQNSAN